MSLHDVLVDLVCEQESFVACHEDNGEHLGKTHKGFLAAARVLAAELHEHVAQALTENDGYGLVMTGHSLGAGVASLLTLLWAPMPVFKSRNIRAYAFGVPCCLCYEISQSPFARAHITSVVLGDDIVCRLSLSTFKELQRDLVALSEDFDFEEKMKILEKLPREDNAHKLFCPGRVLLLESTETNMIPCYVDPVTTLGHIELASDMFGVHRPDRYLEAMKKL